MSWPLNELLKLTMLWTTGPWFHFHQTFFLSLIYFWWNNEVFVNDTYYNDLFAKKSTKTMWCSRVTSGSLCWTHYMNHFASSCRQKGAMVKWYEWLSFCAGHQTVSSSNPSCHLNGGKLSQSSSKWVGVSNQRRTRQLCQRYSGAFIPTVPTSSRLCETFTL